MSTLRQLVIESGLEKQQRLIADFRDRIKDAMANDGNVNEESYDNHQQTFQAEVLAEVNLLADELEFATKELIEMKKIDPDHKPVQAEYGAIVETDVRTFFVSASLEEFMVSGRPFFGVSINSPIYQDMKGKRVGDSFTVRGTTYNIRKIY